MTSTPQADIVTLGESMVTFLPSRPGPLADVPSFERTIGGAESNVACTLARAGHRARWISHVGADGFGEHLVRTIAASGVDTSAVRRDPHRPTGIYFRTHGERAVSLSRTDAPRTDAPRADPPPSDPPPSDRSQRPAEVAYYRAGSAASAMSPDTVDLTDIDSAHVLHLTGITAALSHDCLALLRTLTAPRPKRPLVSFDINYRLALWPRPDDARVLLELARGCDLVFVGEDEAEAAWGATGGPEAIRAALPEPATLVVKQGALGATTFVRDPAAATVRDDPAVPSGSHTEDITVHVRPPRVDIVAPVGAGDAFAAGYLSATLRALPVTARLRHGHLLAAAALTVPGDLAPPPARTRADQLVALTTDAWETLRLGPGWTTTHTKATADR